jgi:hypothetical protein
VDKIMLKMKNFIKYVHYKVSVESQLNFEELMNMLTEIYKDCDVPMHIQDLFKDNQNQFGELLKILNSLHTEDIILFTEDCDFNSIYNEIILLVNDEDFKFENILLNNTLTLQKSKNILSKYNVFQIKNYLQKLVNQTIDLPYFKNTKDRIWNLKPKLKFMDSQLFHTQCTFEEVFDDYFMKINKFLKFEFKAKKLIKISMSYDDKKNVIGSIKITGDFFIHPEETLESLEANLIDTKLERNEISKKVEESLKNSEAFGFDVNSMTDAIMGCLKNE